MKSDQAESNSHEQVWQQTDTAELRRKLLRFATLQLHDAQWAEDVVQDTMLKAFARRQQFKADAQWQTWVFAILRNTLLDSLRSHYEIGRAPCRERV